MPSAPSDDDLDWYSKRCGDCGDVFPLSEFAGSRCRSCRNAYHRRKWAELSPEDRRAAGHKSHGRPLTPDEYAAKESGQQGRCAICGAEPPERTVGRPRADGTRAVRSGLVYDHDHKTGAGRGLLCGSCNTMLGHAGDEPARLEAAAAYLREWAARNAWTGSAVQAGR